jgi:predicted nucleic acid-binding protein
MVCVDAGVIISLLTPEDYSVQVERLWEEWSRQRVMRMAPALLRYEVTAVLRKKLWRGLMREDQAEQALARAFRLPIRYSDPQDLHLRAWELARRLKQPSAYDCHYLALAETLDCRCWTTDKRLYNSVHAAFGGLSWLGEG